MNFRKEIVETLYNSLNKENEIISIEDIDNSITIPPNNEMGDYAFPCFRLAKILKKSPQVIAEELINKIEKKNFIDDIKFESSYINFYINKEIFAKETIMKVIEEGNNYGKCNLGEGRVVTIDYSSPNIAKPFHIGHLRSTAIGNALYNIFNYLGYKSVGINHLGDWGTQFGKLIVAYRKWGNEEEVNKSGISELTKIYVKFHEEAEDNPLLNEEAREWFLKMQNGNKEALNYWKWFYDISINEFSRIYKRLDVEFDYYTGESFYNDKMQPVVQELKDKNLLVESQGAMIVDLEKYKMPPCLILRSDGGTLYPTRDISAALYRKNEFNFSKAIYITALDQKLHFEQWFKVLELMDYEWAKDELVFIPFGLVTLKSGKLSTRKGQVVLMEDILNEAVDKTKAIIEEKNPDLEDKNQVAEDVGIGAIIFSDLYNGRIKEVVFSWEKMLNFEGETGPYVQYAHARANSLIEKGKISLFEDIDFSILSDKNAINCIKLIYDFQEKVIEASKKYEPFIITRHLVDLAQSFNKFYHDSEQIIDADDKTRTAKLALVFSIKTVLQIGLNMIGIKAPNKM